MAAELEKIAWNDPPKPGQTSHQHYSFQTAGLPVDDRREEAAWKDLCREAEEILKPTLQLATQIANAYDEIRQQSTNLMAFTEVRTDPLTGVNNRRGLDDALERSVRHR